MFRAGIARCDITPEPGISLAGHMQDRVATHVHDRLYARCLVLDNGEARLAFVMVDSCMLPRSVCDQAKQRIHETTAIAPSHVLIAATHTHSGPCATPVFQSDPDPAYQDRLVQDIAAVVLTAVERLEPARIAWGGGAVADEVFNRRWHMKEGGVPANPFGETGERVRMNPPRQDEKLLEPAGPTDPEIPFIALERPGGAPLAVLANYALHYVGGTAAGAMSADYFGCFADSLESLLTADGDGGRCLVMLSNGASGDVNNINFREPAPERAPYEQMRLVADKVAREVYRCYQTLSFHDWAPLAALLQDATVGVRLPDEDDVVRARQTVNAAEGPEMRTLEEIYARETLLLAAYPERVNVPLQALCVGEAAIAAVPCEVFVEIGLALKKNSPFACTLPIALANGYNGYLPTAAQHALGGYETWRARSSYLEIMAAAEVEHVLGGLLARLRA